jgi:uncharacterized protein (TIRG00374 family)
MTPQDWASIKDALQHANYWLIIPAFLLLLFSNLMRAVRWGQLIEPLGHRPSTLNLLCAVQIGYLANLAVPRLGEVIRCTTLAKSDKIPTEKLIGTIVAERFVDVICLGLLICLTLITEFDTIGSYAADIYHSISNAISNSSSGKWWLLLAIIVFIFLFVWVVKKFKASKWGNAINRILKGLWEGLLSVKKVKNKFTFIAYSLLMWTAYIVTTWLACITINETSHLGITTAFAMLTFGTFGIIVAPGGLGAYPFAIQKTLLLYGVAENIGKAIGWLSWFIQFVFLLSFGLIAYILLLYLARRKNEKSR